LKITGGKKMNSSIYRFTLDLHSTQSQISLPVTRGDTARAFHITLADGNMPFYIADGCLVGIAIKRPTGTRLEEWCKIEKNTTIIYEFSQNVNTAAVEGVHYCSVTLYDAEGKKIASPKFTMVVSDKVSNYDDIVLTDEDTLLLESIIDSEASRRVAENERADAEGKRAKAEGERALAESKRVEEYEMITNALIGGTSRVVDVELLASKWVGTEDPYSQVLNIPGVTEYSKVDLMPSVEQLAIFHDKDIALLTENEDGVVTAYCIGDKPQNDYIMQATVTEVVEYEQN
jgi:hypothetical protein